MKSEALDGLVLGEQQFMPNGSKCEHLLKLRGLAVAPDHLHWAFAGWCSGNVELGGRGTDDPSWAQRRGHD